MPKYARIHNGLVVGWIDTDEFDYPILDHNELVEVPDQIWEDRGGFWKLEESKLTKYELDPTKPSVIPPKF